MLKAFYLTLTAAEKATVSQLAQTVFLKNPREWIPQNRNTDQNNDQEEGETNDAEEQENLENNDEQREDAAGSIHTPNRSPRNSIQSSKSVMIRGRNYKTRKERISKLIDSIESDPDGVHSENLEKQATVLNSMLKELDIPGIIELAATEPDFIEIFSETED